MADPKPSFWRNIATLTALLQLGPPDEEASKAAAATRDYMLEVGKYNLTRIKEVLQVVAATRKDTDGTKDERQSNTLIRNGLESAALATLLLVGANAVTKLAGIDIKELTVVLTGLGTKFFIHDLPKGKIMEMFRVFLAQGSNARMTHEKLENRLIKQFTRDNKFVSKDEIDKLLQESAIVRDVIKEVVTHPRFDVKKFTQKGITKVIPARVVDGVLEQIRKRPLDYTKPQSFIALEKLEEKKRRWDAAIGKLAQARVTLPIHRA